MPNTPAASSGVSSPTEDEDEFQKLQFPWKLHRLLDEADANGHSSVISWMTDGGSFKVHNKQTFAENVMPKYFESSKFKSFQRSLNLWGFQTVQKGLEKGQCIHRFFIRGHPDLCVHMNRTKIKGTAMKKLQIQQAATMNQDVPLHASATNNSFAASSSTLPHIQMIDHLRAADACARQAFAFPSLHTDLSFLEPKALTGQNLLVQALYFQKQKELVEYIVQEAMHVLRR